MITKLAGILTDPKILSKEPKKTGTSLAEGNLVLANYSKNIPREFIKFLNNRRKFQHFSAGNEK